MGAAGNRVGLAAGKPVIPLLVGGRFEIPGQECLPDDIRQLVDRQAFSLREEQWDADVANLADTLIRLHHFRETEAQVLKPWPEVEVAQFRH